MNAALLDASAGSNDCKGSSPEHVSMTLVTVRRVQKHLFNVAGDRIPILPIQISIGMIILVLLFIS